MIRAAFLALGFAFVVSGAQAAQWKVDHAHSRLGFSVQWSGLPFTATFRKWDADIAFDPVDLVHAKASVTIDMASAFSGEAELDENLPGPQGFDTAHFPQAHFVTGSIRSTGTNHYRAVGDLTIHGVTKQIALPFTLVISGNSAHMTGEVTVSRIDFGVGTEGAWAGETAVAHAVKVTVDLTATKS